MLQRQYVVITSQTDILYSVPQPRRIPNIQIQVHLSQKAGGAAQLAIYP